MLSVWQLNRHFWKKELLETRRKALEEEPDNKDLPKKPPGDIRRVELTGSFYNDDYILIELRRPQESTLGVIAEKGSCMVFVPFITNTNKHVMVCKGQVPESVARDPEKMREVLAGWPVNVAGLRGVYRKAKKKSARSLDVRLDERRYKHPCVVEMWTDWYDKYQIKDTVREPLPYFIDIVDQPYDTPYPLTRARQEYATHVITPAVHLVYFATWTVAFAFSVYTFKRHGARQWVKGMKQHQVWLGGTDGFGGRYGGGGTMKLPHEI